MFHNTYMYMVLTDLFQFWIYLLKGYDTTNDGESRTAVLEIIISLLI